MDKSTTKKQVPKNVIAGTENFNHPSIEHEIGDDGIAIGTEYLNFPSVNPVVEKKKAPGIDKKNEEIKPPLS